MISNVAKFIVLSFVLLPCSASALTPEEAIKAAIANNPSFQETGLTVRQSRLRAQGQESVRPFILSAEGGYNFQEQPQAGVINSGVAKSDFVSLSADLAKQLVWGTQIGLGLGFNRSKSEIPFTVADLMIEDVRIIGPNYGGSLELTVAQPLLKGFGADLNDLSLDAARQQLTVAEMQRARAAHDLTSQVLNAYWSWIQAEREVDAIAKSVERTKTIGEMTVAQIEAGTLAELERDIVDQRIAQSEQALLLARAGANDAWQTLEKTMGTPIGGEPETPPESIPVSDAALPTVQALVAQAANANPDLRLLDEDVSANELQLRQSANDVRPKLDAVGSVTQSSLDDNVGGALEQVAKLEFTSYFIGLQFVMPLDNGVARSEHEANQIAVERAKLRKTQAMREVESSVRQAHRLVVTQRERLKLSDREVALASKNLAALQEKYQAGLASYLEVLEQQNSLADAELNNAQATVNVMQAENGLRRLTGGLLEAYDIELERVAESP